MSSNFTSGRFKLVTHCGSQDLVHKEAKIMFVDLMYNKHMTRCFR